MKVFHWASMLLVIGGMVMAAPAAELFDKAAPLTVKEWVKGKPVDVTTADGKNIYVVEFWATWCGPCVRSIPHITEMQKKYKDKNVTFIGISVDAAQTVSQVKPFVEKMGDKMEYVVAIDKDGATSKAYMDAFGARGIPHAFIINQQGLIAWQGHPADDLEEVIDLILKGGFDKETAKKLSAKREEEQKKQMAEKEKQYKAQLAALAVVEDYKKATQSEDGKEKAAELAKKILKDSAELPMVLNDVAWYVLTDETIKIRDLKFALQAAKLANEKTENKEPAMLDTYALALFENGKIDEAIKMQTKVIELVKEDATLEPYLGEFNQRLEKFKAAKEK